MAAIFSVRDQIGTLPLHAMTLLNPAIILAEPALLRHGYRRVKPKGPLEEKVVAKTLRFLQTQKGLHNETDVEYLKDLQQSPAAQMLLMERQSELMTFTLGVGLKAAQTCSAVMRLSPGVNHVFSNLSAYARHVRSHKIEARLKTLRLFEAIQKGLKEAIGDERIAFVLEQGGPLKILSDAPSSGCPSEICPCACEAQLRIEDEVVRITARPRQQRRVVQGRT